mgnify:CR=1 FL=1
MTKRILLWIFCILVLSSFASADLATLGVNQSVSASDDDSEDYYAVNFTLAEEKQFGIVTLSHTGDSNDITLRIHTDNAGVPSTTLAHANAIAHISPPSGHNIPRNYTFPNGNVTLSAGTYWIKVTRSGSQRVWGANADYPQSTWLKGDNSTWNPVALRNMFFQIWNNSAAPPPVVSTGNKSITETWVPDPVLETTLTTHNMTVKLYNLTTASNGTLTYNGTVYSGTQLYANSSYVVYQVNITPNIIPTDNYNYLFYWNLTLEQENGTIIEANSDVRSQTAQFAYTVNEAKANSNFPDGFETDNVEFTVNYYSLNASGVNITEAVLWWNGTQLNMSKNPSRNNFTGSINFPLVTSNHTGIKPTAAINVTQGNLTFFRNMTTDVTNYIDFGYFMKQIVLPDSLEKHKFPAAINISERGNAILGLYFQYHGTIYSPLIGASSEFNNATSAFIQNITTPHVYLNDTRINGTTWMTVTFDGVQKIRNKTNFSNQVYWNLTGFPRNNITVHDIINGNQIDNFTVSNGLSVNTSSDSFVIYRHDQTELLNLTVDAYNYSYGSQLVNFTADMFLSHQFKIYTSNSFNFTFLDERTGDLLINKNFNVEIIGEDAAYNFTANNGTLYADLLVPQDYTIRYKSLNTVINNSYSPIRHHFITLNNRSHKDLSLYVLESTNASNITITVREGSTLDLIQDATIYVQRYFIDDNTFKTVTMGQTDSSGIFIFDVEKDDTYYKFMVDYPFRTSRIITSKQYITEDVKLFINLFDDPTQDFYQDSGISYNLAYNDATESFIATYSDPSLAANQYCFYLRKNGQYSQETLNSSCTTANSGSIELKGIDNSTANFGIFTAKIQGKERTIASVWTDFQYSTLNAGPFGVFMAAVLFCMFVFLGSLHYFALILGTVSLVFARFLGLLSLDWAYIIMMVIASIILAMIIEMKRRR